ncbi:portal protein [Pseudanabaena phage Pan5]|nr:portal protein [Pseudanabaena phage Pan5]
MILSIEEVQDIILNNPNKELLKTHRDYSKKLRMHLYGTGLKDHLTKIEGLEKPSLKELRAKYARSNKALFAALGRPIDKVFSAKGGSVYLSLSDAQEKQIKDLSGRIRHGQSVRKWLQRFWEPHFRDDPGGIIFMEIATGVTIADRSTVPFTFPTYKSSTTIYDYKLAGSRPQYVVFELTKEEIKANKLDPGTYYRVVDDLLDRIVKLDGAKVTELRGLTLTNPFGYVPAIINSDYCSPDNDNVRLSIFDEVLDLADEYLLTGSIKKTFNFLLGFPKYWEYADDCGKCDGSGMHEGEKCGSCEGTGRRPMTKVSDVKLLTPPTSKEDPTIAPNVAGFVTPPKDYQDIATQELDGLRSMMEFTMWGRTEIPKVQGPDATKTATEIVGDQQPMIDRLTDISEMAQIREKFILDALVRIQLPNPSYQGSSVLYGRRYQLEGPDMIWLKYAEAKAKGAPVSMLDDFLDEYIEAKYGTDPMQLALNKKLKEIEPFVHLTIDQVSRLPIANEDKLRKVYFSEWFMSMPDTLLVMSSTESLRQLLTDYVSQKEIQPDAAPVN